MHRSLHCKLAFLFLFLTLSLSSVFAQHIVSQVPVGNDVTDGQGNQVFVVAGNTNKVVATVPLSGIEPTGVAANPVTRSVYVTEFGSAQVEIIR